MSGLWFFKWPLMVFIAGFSLCFIGALFKIRYWPMADEMITMRTPVGGLEIIFGIIKIAYKKKPNP